MACTYSMLVHSRVRYFHTPSLETIVVLNKGQIIASEVTALLLYVLSVEFLGTLDVEPLIRLGLVQGQGLRVNQNPCGAHWVEGGQQRKEGITGRSPANASSAHPFPSLRAVPKILQRIWSSHKRRPDFRRHTWFCSEAGSTGLLAGSVPFP